MLIEICSGLDIRNGLNIEETPQGCRISRHACGVSHSSIFFAFFRSLQHMSQNITALHGLTVSECPPQRPPADGSEPAGDLL